MLTEAERVKLYELVYAFRDGRGGLTGIEQHVESLCAQARADALEEAAKAMDDQARRWSELQHSMLADATEERAYAQGRINAFTEAEGEIRARKDGQ